MPLIPVDALISVAKKRNIAAIEVFNKNLKMLEDAAITYKKNTGNRYVMVNDKIKVRYYASSGRWIHNSKSYYGDASKFINWWRLNNVHKIT